MAEAAKNPEHKQTWLRLAASWFRMLPNNPPRISSPPAPVDGKGEEPPEAR
jgi:hypothetical protein